MDRFERFTANPGVGQALTAVAKLFKEMEAVYGEHAQAYGFQCKGCEDSCCLTRFYHHTLLEVLFLHRGLRTLPADHRDRILSRCREVCRIYRQHPDTADPERVLCPLNEDGQCVIYPYRPMICRLHGIPHELNTSTGGLQHHPGCHMFTRNIGMSVPYRTFDRTPFYQRMANLEQTLRRELGFNQRLKLTVAHMLLAEELLTHLYASPSSTGRNPIENHP